MKLGTWSVFLSVKMANQPDLLGFLRTHLEEVPGYKVSSRNGQCWMYGYWEEEGGDYKRISYKKNGKRTSVTVQRAAIMVREGTTELGDGMEASHLCHNKHCVRPDHLALETNSLNQKRKQCLKSGKCVGHGSAPDCLLGLYLRPKCK